MEQQGRSVFTEILIIESGGAKRLVVKTIENADQSYR
jgi:hypothetical protein